MIAPGTVFGRLTVTGDSKRRKTHRYWRCECACGEERWVSETNLKAGRQHSCGCWKREIDGQQFRTHGASRTALYRIWLHMRARCENPQDPAWPNYGGRGITVCEHWRHFEGFYADMAPRLSEQHSLDRIDNDKGYSPDNCRWATRREQVHNSRRIRRITYQGKTLSLGEWATGTGINRRTIAQRLDHGWPVERALTAPA